MFARSLTFLFIASAMLGCTHTQLRRNTANQMSTIHDLQQQQVLDNLAMFVHNRSAYPYFSMITQGTSTLEDSASLEVTNGWERATSNLVFQTLGITPSASRATTEAWVINPINDSVKLQLMRCCYQRAVDGCMGGETSDCPDCDAILNGFYGAIEKPEIVQAKMENVRALESIAIQQKEKALMLEKQLITAQKDSRDAIQMLERDKDRAEESWNAFKASPAVEENPDATTNREKKGKEVQAAFDEKRRALWAAEDDARIETKDLETKIKVAKQEAADSEQEAEDAKEDLNGITPHLAGIVTPNCVKFRGCWFCYGKKVPKHYSKCCKVGHYCGTYVWVPQDQMDQLTKLTILIQDIAYYDFNRKPSPVTNTTLQALTMLQATSPSPSRLTP